MKIQRPLSLLAIWNMSFGFLAIQFGFGLQLANMSAIYAKLGADASKIPLLWLAGPMTGLIVQPIIGAMSDRTWTRLGRRRPYFLVGALLASVALFFMPDAPALWVAAGMLWVLDTSINVSMEPFRAFVADKLPDQQRTLGFVMQSFFIGSGRRWRTPCRRSSSVTVCTAMRPTAFRSPCYTPSSSGPPPFCWRCSTPW